VSGVTFIVFISTLLGGCAVSYMDKPRLPPEYYWFIDGRNPQQARADLVACTKVGLELFPEASFERGFYYDDYCMLKKGYEFINRPKNSFPHCIRNGVFWNHIACQYHRGNIHRLNDGVLVWHDGRVVEPDEFMH
jgi:hypothetical protein